MSHTVVRNEIPEMETKYDQIIFLVFVFITRCEILPIHAGKPLDSLENISPISERNKKCLTIAEGPAPHHTDGYDFPTFEKIKLIQTTNLRGRRSVVDPSEDKFINQSEKYPTEKDRDMVEIALENLTFANGGFYETLKQDHLYCPLSATCSLKPRLTYNDFKIYQSCCLQCSCQKDCFSSGSCCADASIIEDGTDYACTTSQYLPYGKSQVDNKFRIVSVVKCNSQFSVKETKELCERQTAALENLDFSRPVVANNIIYRNKFCALCNFVNESNIQPFTAQLMCPNTEGIYSYSVSNLLKKLVSEKRCNILYYLPYMLPVKKCYIGFIRECNITGKWRHYDPHVEKACMSYTHVYRGIYRNVFCYMCNNDDDPFMKCSYSDIRDIGGFTMGSFTAMLRFSEDTDENVLRSTDQPCKEDEIMDNFKETCLLVRCSPPFSYNRGNKACSKVYQDSKTSYELFLLVSLDREIDTDLFYPYLEDYLRHGCPTWRKRWLRVFQVPHLNSSIYHLIYDDNDSENRINHMLDAVKHFKKESGLIIDIEILTGQIYDDLENLSSYKFPYNDNPLKPIESNHTLSFNFYSTSIQRVSRLLVCPFITIENYTTVLNKTTYELCVEELDICFHQSEFREINDSFLVCSDKFEKKMEELVTTAKKKLANYDDLEGIISMVCTCISVASLLYVALTFFLFKSLRTYPGKLTLMLAISLLTAHLFYLFGLFQTKHPIICRTLGILIHFSWLWVIFWMNISCFHMVSVFSRGLPTDLNTKSRFVCYTLYVFLCSISFVGINIVVTYVQGRGIGYGDNICWISRPEMIGYCFALPLGLVIIANLLMFLGVVITLCRRPNIQSIKHRNRQDFIIFVKLTSITGISWVFGFLYEWLSIKAFSYLFIVITGCQGFYLMVAFSCNSRVRRLYRDALGDSVYNTSTKSNSTIVYGNRVSR